MLTLTYRAVVSLWLVLVLAAPADGASAFPKHFDLRYILNRQGLDIAEVHWRLAPLKDRGFRYSSRSQTIGLAKLFRDEQITEVSDWRFDQGRLQSLRYQYSRTGGKRRRQAQARFDWAKGSIHNSLNGRQWTIPLPANTYDKLNYLLALMHDLDQGLRVAQFLVADGAKLKVYKLRYLNEQRIETAIGPVQCLVLERSVPGSGRITRVWAAKALHYLPLKIEHTEKGETVTLTLSKLTALDGYQPADGQATSAD